MKTYFQRLRNKRGATAVTVSILLVVLIGSAALALDIGHLAVVRNELQNAADAGALGGARVLYDIDASGVVTGINPGAKVAAQAAAMANNSDNSAVEVDLAADVQTGNWDGSSFTPSTPSNETDLSFVNAVRVTAHRSAAYAIFASIFADDSFPALAHAVAYRGFAGSNVSFDQPIAICEDMLVDSSGNYVCTTGRMFSNGSGSSTVGTARWTNMSEGCTDSADAGDIQNAVRQGCIGGLSLSPDSIPAVSTSDGAITPALAAVYNCWAPLAPATMPTTSWEIVLPVVQCVSPPTCSQIVGSVKVKVVWITANGRDSHYNNIPVQMDGWSQSANCSGMDLGTDAGRQQCWNSFATYFNLMYMNTDGTESPATYQPATLYFVPSCEYTAAGSPGGIPSSVFSLYPKLVE